MVATMHHLVAPAGDEDDRVAKCGKIVFGCGFVMPNQSFKLIVIRACSRVVFMLGWRVLLRRARLIQIIQRNLNLG